MDTIELTIGTYTQGDAPARGVFRAWVAADGSSAGVRGVTELADPSWIVARPGGGFLYAVSEGAQGRVAALAKDATGELRLLNTQPTGGAEPCYASIIGDGAYLAAANYTSGSVSVHPIRQDGSLGEQTNLTEHVGSGPDSTRQESAHAHMVVEDPEARFVLAVDLGTDSIYAYELDAEAGTLCQVSRSQLRPSFGPRHLAFHPDGQYVYVIGELGFEVAVCEYDAATGALSVLSQTPVLSGGVPGTDFPSGIRISRDGRFLYTANRGRDTLCTFNLAAEPTKPELVATTPTGGAWPRDIVLTADGRLLLSANQHSDSVTVFRLDPKTGVPAQTGTTLRVPAPSCILPA